jgi:hypothetical protein
MVGFVPKSGRRIAAGSCLEPRGRGSEREERGGAGGTATCDLFGCDIIRRILE